MKKLMLAAATLILSAPTFAQIETIQYEGIIKTYITGIKELPNGATGPVLTQIRTGTHIYRDTTQGKCYKEEISVAADNKFELNGIIINNPTLKTSKQEMLCGDAK